MFTSDAEALEWFNAHSGELRRRADEIFRRHLERERRKKAQGEPKYFDSWTWEQAIAEVLMLPESSTLVQGASRDLRVGEQRHRLENYDDDDRFQRLLDRFEKACSEASDATP